MDEPLLADLDGLGLMIPWVLIENLLILHFDGNVVALY